MRKQYKKKLRSCSLCKPHKMKKSKRWSLKDGVLLKEFEKGIQLEEEFPEDYKHAEQGCD